MATEPPRNECCPPSLALLDEAEAARLSALLKVVADPVRLRLLHHIAAAPDTTACACHLPTALGISQPTLSHHLKRLTDAGLISREQRGRWAHYRLVRDAMDHLASAFSGIAGSDPAVG